MIKHHQIRYWWILIFVISLIPLFDLLHPGLPVTHDGQDHVARIANFYASLSEGNIVPRWAGNLNWGYGHPVMMFLYPLPSYLASLFHSFGWGLVDSLKLVFASTYVLSVLGMFLWAGSVWGIEAGMVAAILYGFAPYRFVDLYVRGAIGEHVAFACVPYILWAMWIQARHGKITRISSSVMLLGTAALILSHNALSLMFIPLIILYGLYLILYEVKQRARFGIAALLCLGWGFALSAFFWIPAFFEGKYTLRDIVTGGDFLQRFVPWNWFIKSSWNYGGGNEFSKSLGSAQWFGLLIALCIFRKANKECRMMVGFLIAILATSLFLMTSGSVWIWQTVTLLQKFQFPWRLLSISVFVLSGLAGIGISGLPYAYKRVISVLLCVLAIVSTAGMWHAKEYRNYSEKYFTSVYHGTTDTGESSPIWSIRFMEHEPNASMENILGNAKISNLFRSTTHHAYSITGSLDTRVVENTLYFPGWVVSVDGKPVSVQFQDPEYRGLMTFMVPSGTHKVDVRFGQTNVRRFADILSGVSAMLFIVFLGTMPIWQGKVQRYL